MIKNNLSFSFNALRFPLCILVVFIHSEGGYPDNTSYWFRHFFSHELCSFAVPIFFIISGYLFFHKFSNKFDLTLYQKKLHSRIHTLILPYIGWNIITLFLDFFKYLRHEKTWINYDVATFTDIVKLTLWSNNNGYPIDLPLWYIRDLIILCILSPIIYYINKYKRVGESFILLLIVTYIFSIIKLPFNITGLLYFSIGAYFSIHNKNLITNKTLLLLFIAIIFIGTYKVLNIQYLLKLYILFASFGIITLASYNNPTTRIFASLSKYSTIIYFSHYPISLILAIKIINILPITYSIFTYLITPFIAAIISIIILEIYQTIKRYAFK